MTSLPTNPMTKKVQRGDTSERWQQHVVSRGAERRHLITQEAWL
jgi:hypothetical protein